MNDMTSTEMLSALTTIGGVQMELTAKIVCSYVSHNNIPPGELPGLIRSVYETFTGLGLLKEVAAPAEPLVPKVPIKKSVFPDRIISLIDGKSYKSLKRHVGTHGFTPETYRAAYGLPADYPMVCHDYSTARSDLAKTMGLGRKAKPASEEV